MKKTLMTLAALAATGSAFAQSSVSITGGMAIGFKHQTAKSDKPDGAKNLIVNNQQSANNITFRFNEDLGDGLSTLGYVNVRFSPDDGSLVGGGGKPGENFAQEVKLSLRGNFGQISLGRFNAPVDNMVHPAIDPYIPLGLGTTIYGGPLDAISRYNGTIEYAAPKFGGFETRFAIVPKGEMNSEVDTHEIAVKYSTDKLNLGFGYTENSGNSNGTTNYKGRNVLTLGGLYNFDVAKVGLSYHKVDSYKLGSSVIAESDRKNLGVRVPINSKTSFKFGYENQKSKGSNSVDATAMGIDYYLSKRTMLSADIGKVSSKNPAKDDKGINYVLGIKHTF